MKFFDSKSVATGTLDALFVVAPDDVPQNFHGTFGNLFIRFERLLIVLRGTVEVVQSDHILVECLACVSPYAPTPYLKRYTQTILTVF